VRGLFKGKGLPSSREEKLKWLEHVFLRKNSPSCVPGKRKTIRPAKTGEKQERTIKVPGRRRLKGREERSCAGTAQGGALPASAEGGVYRREGERGGRKTRRGEGTSTGEGRERQAAPGPLMPKGSSLVFHRGKKERSFGRQGKKKRKRGSTSGKRKS